MPKVLQKSCQDKCGNVTIPFPFGIGKHCYFDESFGVECNKSSNTASLSFLGGAEYSKISLQGYVTIIDMVFPAACYNKSGDGAMVYWWNRVTNTTFSVSPLNNKFVAIGCDIYAYIQGDDGLPAPTGCASFCNDDLSWSNLTSAGRGYCETALPRTMKPFGVNVAIYSVNTFTKEWIKKPCGFAFPVDKEFSQFDQFKTVTVFNFSDLNNRAYYVPVVLNWAIGNVSCREASKSNGYLCGRNAKCRDANDGGGYNCYCRQGYQGNPYLSHGCLDINECEDPKKCKGNTICNNIPGNYECICPRGHDRSFNTAPDGSTQMRCVPGHGDQFSPKILLLGVGTSIVVLILIAFSFWLYRHFERRNKIRIKQKFFKRNGGLLFQQQISSSKGSVMKTKVFVAEELEKATDNFNQSRVLGKGGLGTVYKGMLQDGSIVAVKKSNMVDENQVGQFINEVSILLQIDHRNIVNLLGCCLETEVPLLVYEYVSNGTLSHHLHDEGCESTISWENCLQIAKEVAEALAYLHSYASTSIFHRDIKSSNILLDENFRAVVSDFGFSRSISIEKTHLTTVVGGTFGYLDP